MEFQPLPPNYLNLLLHLAQLWLTRPLAPGMRSD